MLLSCQTINRKQKTLAVTDHDGRMWNHFVKESEKAQNSKPIELQDTRYLNRNATLCCLFRALKFFLVTLKNKISLKVPLCKILLLVRKCPTNYTMYNHCGQNSDYSKPPNNVCGWTHSSCVIIPVLWFFLFFIWTWKKLDKWTPIGSVTLTSCLLVFCFFVSLSLVSICSRTQGHWNSVEMGKDEEAGQTSVWS